MGHHPRIETVPRIGDAMTPDQDLSARLGRSRGTMKAAYLHDAYRSGQLLTLADHERAVQAAVAKAVEACAVWHDREAAGAMNSLHCGSENSEYRAANRLCEFHRASAAAIRSRGVAG